MWQVLVLYIRRYHQRHSSPDLVAGHRSLDIVRHLEKPLSLRLLLPLHRIKVLSTVILQVLISHLNDTSLVYTCEQIWTSILQHGVFGHMTTPGILNFRSTILILRRLESEIVAIAVFSIDDSYWLNNTLLVLATATFHVVVPLRPVELILRLKAAVQRQPAPSLMDRIPWSTQTLVHVLRLPAFQSRFVAIDNLLDFVTLWPHGRIGEDHTGRSRFLTTLRVLRLQVKLHWLIISVGA